MIIIIIYVALSKSRYVYIRALVSRTIYTMESLVSPKGVAL